VTVRPSETVDLDELGLVLSRELSWYFSRPVRIASLESSSFAYSTSFALRDLQIRLDDGQEIRLILKDLSWEGLHDQASRVKPSFLHNPDREIEVYRDLLRPSGLVAPTFYGAEIDREQQRYWLFVEYIPGYTLFEVETRLWPAAAVWLAALHRHFSDSAQLTAVADRGHLVRYDADFYRQWPSRALAFIRGQNLDPQARRRFEHLAGSYEQVVARLDRLPQTLIHGEFFASNVLVRELEEGTRIYPIDWEMAGVGPGLLDVAALTAGNWTSEQRNELASVYWDALDETSHPGWSEFLQDLTYCRLHIAVQWLGWAPDWTPPPEHTHNWLGDVLALAEALDL
jgi:aminoglycoside phosphotransferase (APT) family kinase protein